MAKTSLTFRIELEGVRSTLRAFRKLPKSASQELRRRTLELSQDLANKVRADGMGDAAPQSPNVASTVRANRDRVPNISAGGMKRLGRNRKPAYKLLFGSVFGSNQYGQFHRPHGGREAYWFFPVVEEEAPRIAAAWQRVADDILDEFGRGV